MHKASDFSHRVPQFRRVIRDIENDIHSTSEDRGANPEAALSLLRDSSDALLVESLVSLSAMLPSKVYRQELRQLINSTLWPQLLQLMPTVRTPPDVSFRQEMEERNETLLYVRDQIKMLALRTVLNDYQPARWSMRWVGENDVVYTWRGADVRITGNPNHGYTGSNTVVVTPYAAELAGLFIEVRDTSGDLVDHMSKYELYGRLAQTAIDAHQADPNLTLRSLTLEVLAEWADIMGG